MVYHSMSDKVRLRLLVNQLGSFSNSAGMVAGVPLTFRNAKA